MTSRSHTPRLRGYEIRDPQNRCLSVFHRAELKQAELLTQNQSKKTAAQEIRKKPDADGLAPAHQASGFRYGLYEIRRINV